MSSPNNSFEGVDLAGIGKIAKAIPEEVYVQSADTLLTTFRKLVAPITEATGGLGRYIRQKFDNMVLVEKALATFTLEKAMRRAADKSNRYSSRIVPPAHTKSFVNALEEASKETDPLLHELWANLLASQMTEGFSHPHFVEILSHLSPAEAQLLVSLRDLDGVGEHAGRYIIIFIDRIHAWITHAEDANPKSWNFSCSLLCQFGFADLLSRKGDNDDKPVILYRTASGSRFLKAVSL